MKSIKPGRGPSMMGSMAAVVAAVFGVIWIIGAHSIGAPWYMSAFGILFVLMAVVSAVYNARNATGKNRMSVLDITEDGEEPDPLNRKFGEKDIQETDKTGSRFCPYCGKPIRDDFTFCNSCGRKLPDADAK